MEKILINKVELTVNNYREAKRVLRNDGDIVNHFASLIFARYESSLSIDRIREIRKYIKSTTNRLSYFRGDILNIISILIATNDLKYQNKLIESMYLTLSLLEDNGFKKGANLSLVSYVIARYAKDNENEKIVLKTKQFYEILNNKYKNITQEDDYLICALWSLNDIENDTIYEFTENVFEYISSNNIRSKNCIQAISNSIILNGSSGNMYRTIELINEFQKREIKLADQFYPMIGMIFNINPRRVVDLVEGIIDELCYEEYEYEYYLDKGFRSVIAIFILQSASSSDKKLYIDEFLAHGILSFINSKNKSIFEDILG